jgi:transposase
MTASVEQCVAATRGCGSPSGWRQGGRCPACRAAHNADTNRRRNLGTLSDTERQIVLGALRQGQKLDEAAVLTGRTPSSLTRQAAVDSELRLALEGAPLPVQRVARQGDYLAALTRHEGDPASAVRELLVGESLLASWRKEPAFTAAEQAVRTLAGNSAKRPKVRITKEMAEQAANVLYEGGTITEAARRIGSSQQALRRVAHLHPPLAAALPPVQPNLAKGGKKRAAVNEARLRELWADDALTQDEIARALGVRYTTVYRWAKDLGLPRRARRGRR